MESETGILSKARLTYAVVEVESNSKTSRTTDSPRASRDPVLRQ